MDLAKIIAQLRTELACIDSAIASIEQLGRVKNTPPGGMALPIPEGGQTETGAPVKRGRGRPRKVPAARSVGPATAASDSEKAKKEMGSAGSAA